MVRHGRAIQQIEKALTTMNIRLANAISDVSGVTGMAIIRAILKGERDPRELAKLREKSGKRAGAIPMVVDSHAFTIDSARNSVGGLLSLLKFRLFTRVLAVFASVHALG